MCSLKNIPIELFDSPLDCDCVSSEFSVQVPGASRGSDLRAGEQGFRSLHALRLRLALTRRGLHA